MAGRLMYMALPCSVCWCLLFGLRSLLIRYLDKNANTFILAFFELLKAGLWEREIELSPFDKNESDELLRLASEQSVVGLMAAGIENVRNVCVPKDVILELAGNTLQIEQRNKAMNDYVAKLIDVLRKEDIYAILVKGQGIAQCYERPMWRSCGDIDLLLSDDNYQKARNYLTPLAIKINDENHYKKHLAMK